MLRSLSRLLHMRRSKMGWYSGVGPSTWDSLFASLVKSQGRFAELAEASSHMQRKLGEATGLLDDGREEYLNLYVSRLNVLREVGELIIKYERRGYRQVAKDLEELLLLEKFERFEPAVGEAVPSGRCIVDGKVESRMLPHGSVSLVSAPGFCTAGGQVVALEAHVYQAVWPQGAGMDKIIIGESQDAEGIGAQALSHFLLLKACTFSDE
jgi:hypothetical protein